jgi:ADP-heptose:LPS heptosyltransferase
MPGFLKSIEKAVKKQFDKNSRKPGDSLLVENPEEIFYFKEKMRILLLRHDRIGDVLVTTPFLRELRKILPNTKIDILMSSKNIGAKKAVESHVNEIYNYTKGPLDTVGLLSRLNKNNYDLVIDLFDNPSTTSAYVIRLINPLYSLGFDKENRGIYTHLVPIPDKREHHIAKRILNLLMPFGINPEKVKLNLSYPLSNEEKSSAEIKTGKAGLPMIGINLAGSSRAKYYGTENYIELIKKINSKYRADILLFAKSDYNSELNEIKSKTGCRIAPAAESLHDYAAMLGACDLIITPDTAAVHFSSAFGIPCLALYTVSDNPNTGIPWYPLGISHRILQTKEELAKIKVEEVFSAFKELADESKIFN